jgi:hypothetical protein
MLGGMGSRTFPQKSRQPVALLERAHLDLRTRWVKDHWGVMLVIKASKDTIDDFQMAISWARYQL